MKIKFKYIFFILFIFLIENAFSQIQNWAQWESAVRPTYTAGTAGTGERAYKVAISPVDQSVYTVGTYNANNFAANFNLGHSGSGDGFIVKHNAAGVFQWSVKTGSNNATPDIVYGVDVDPSGNVYVVGQFGGIVDFDPSAGVANLTSAGASDIFVAKYTNAGALLWARRAGSTNGDIGYAIKADANGVYITGTYNASGATFPAPNQTITLTSAGGGQDIFCAKYATNGDINWVRKSGSGSASGDTGFDITTDGSNVFLIGEYLGNCNIFDGSNNTIFTLQNQGGTSDVAIIAYDNTGLPIWATNVSSNSTDYGRGICIDANNLYVTGGVRTNASFKYPTPDFVTTSLATNDAFVASINKSNGVFNWAKTIPGSGTLEYGTSIAYHPSGKIYLTGLFNNNINFTSLGGTNFTITTTAGVSDIFVASFFTNGGFYFANKAGSAQADIGWGIDVDPIGDVFVSGEIGTNASFPPFTGQSSGVAAANIFTAKMGCGVLLPNPVAGADQTVCATTATMAATTPTSGAGTWSLMAGSGSPVTPSSPNSQITTLGVGTNTFVWQISSAGCVPLSDTMLIIRDDFPSTSLAGSNQTVCATNATLAGNTPAVGSGSWTLQSGTGNISSATAPNSGLTALGVGINVFQWSISNGVCPPSTSTVSVQRDNVPTTSIAGSNQTVCATTATLAGNVAAVGNGTWTLVSGAGTITNPNSPTSGITGLGVGLNIFEWEIGNGVCPTSSSTVSIQRDNFPSTSVAGSNQTVCATTANLVGNIPAVGSGTWSLVSGGATITNTSLATTGITALAVGVNVFQWEIGNGVCPTSTSTVSVQRDDFPTIANAGPNQTVCATTATFAANAAAVGSGTWTLLSGSGTITNPNSETSGITGLGIGINIFEWEIGNGVCPTTTSTVSIQQDQTPTIANAGPNQTVCATNAIMAANTATIGSGSWSLISGGGTITNSLSPTTAITALAVGVNVFQWQIQNGVCPASVSTVSIQRDAIPTVANAGPNQTLCATTTATLAGNNPAVGTGTWTLISGGGTITNPNSPTSGITALAIGINIFQWTIGNGVCPSSTSTVLIQDDPVPTISNAGPNQIICSTTATLAGNNPSPGAGTWNVLVGSGNVVTPTSANSQVTGLSIGSNVFEWVITSGSCPPSSSTVNIQLDANPTIANAGSNQSVCASSTLMAANTPVIGNGFWTLISGSGTIPSPSSPNTNITGIGVGTNVFQWTISNGVCPSSSSTVSIVRYLPPTPAVAGPNQTLCASPNTIMAANTPAIGTGSWTLISGIGAITTPTLANTTITGLGFGSNIFQWEITNGVCPPSSSTVLIQHDNNPTIASAGSNQTVCASNVLMAANAPAVGTGSWTLISGGGTIVSPTLPNTNITGLGVGVNVFQWTISNGSCPPSISTVSIQQDLPPTISVAGSNQTVCATSALMAANVPAIGTGSWTVVSGSGSFLSTNSPVTSVNPIGVGINVYAWTIGNGVCPPSSSTVLVQQDLNPTLSNAGPSQSVCANTATLSANTPVVGTGVWNVLVGSGIILTPTSPNSQVITLSAGANVFEWTISNGVCPPSSSTVLVQQDLPPSIANAGPSQSLCLVSNATMAANVPAIGTGSWTLISGSGIISAATSPNSGITALGIGVNIFQWTISNGVCPPTTSTMSITRFLNPTASNAGVNQTVCATSAIMSGNTPAVGTGSWTLISGVGTIVTPTLATTNITGLGVGVNVFEWTISNGNCPPSTTTVSIQRDDNPTVSNAGSNQTICSSTTTLAGNIPAVGTGTWSVISGSGIFANANLGNTTVSGLNFGANVFQWTIGNGVCATTSSTVLIQRDQPPTVSAAGINQTVCATSANLAGNTPAVGTGTWTLISGIGTITNANLATSAVTALGGGINVFQWTIGNGVCPNSSSTVSIQRDLPPTASNAGVNQTVCVTNTTTLAGNTPAIGTGTWSVIFGSGTISNPNSPNSTVNPIGLGLNTFQWTIGNGVCANSSSSVSVQVDQVPTIANAGSNQTVCSTNATLAGNLPGVGTGTWTLISGAGTITNPNNFNSPVTLLGAGINVFQWTIGNGVCANSSSTVSIQQDLNPTAANAGPNQTVCATGVTLAGNTPIVGTGVWTLISGSGSITNPNLPNTTVTGLNSIVSNIFQWSISNGVCATSTSTVLIDADDPPTPAIAGPNQTVCATSVTMAANTPAIGTGSWTLISGSGSFVSPTAPNTTITGLGVGINVFQWTTFNGACPATTSTISVQQDVNPTVSNAGPSQSVCANFANLAGNIPAIGNGTWTLISGGGSITNPNLPNTSVTGLSIGANVFQWAISNGVCPVSTSTVLVSADPLPTAANAGPNQVICSSNSNLNGNIPAIGTGSWSLISGAGSITNPNLANTAVTGLGFGINVFQWQISSGACPPSNSTVSIQRDQPPTTSNAGSNQIICSSSATLSANTPIVGTGVWNVLVGGGILLTPTSPNSQVITLSAGANVFEWTISNGVCPPSTSTVLVQQDLPPSAAVAGPSQSLCLVSNATMAATVPTAGTGLWTLLSGSGNITTPTSPNSAITALGIGVNIFQWTTSSGVCPTSSATMSITRYLNPTASVAGANQTVCSNSVTMNGNVPLFGTGLWTLVSGSGTIATPTLATTNITGLGVGVNIFQWTISNGNCAPSSSTVSIQQDLPPTISVAGANQTICATSNPTMTANTPAVGTGTWSVVSGNGTFVNPNAANTVVNSLNPGVNIFQWTIGNGVCATSSSTVSVQQDQSPSPSAAGVNQTVCATVATLNGNTPAVGTGTWSLISGAGTITNPNLPNSGVTGLGGGINVFQWTISNGVCANSSSTVSIQRDLPPTPSVAGPNQTVCVTNTTTLAGNAPAIGTGTWSVIFGSGTFTNPNSPNSTVNPIGLGLNVFQWTIGNGVCATSASTVSVQIDQVPTVSNATPNQTVCSTNATLNGNLPGVGTGTWTLISGGGTITNPNTFNSGVTSLGAGINIFQWTIGNGVCANSTSTVSIQQDLPPTTAVAGPNQTICANFATLAGNTPAIGTGTWSLIFGSGTITNPNQANSGVTGLGINLNIFQWTIGNGVCANSISTVSIQQDQNPTTSLAGPNQTVCGNSATLAGNPPAIGTGTWSILAGGGTFTNPNLANTTVSGLNVGVNIFQWTIGNGVCPSSSSNVSIQQDLAPTAANAGPSQTVCATSAIMAANVPAIGTGTWSLISGGGSIANINLATTNITGLAIGPNIFQWAISNGICPVSTSTVLINADAPPTIATAGANQIVCSTVVTLSGNTPTVGTGLWTLVSGSGTILAPTAPNTNVTGLGVGINIFQWQITSGVCPPSSSTVSIQRDDFPTNSLAGPNQTVCAITATMAGNTPLVGTGVWNVLSGPSAIMVPTSPNSQVVNLGVGANTFEWVISNGVCPPSSSTVLVQRDDNPTASIAGPNQSVCAVGTLMAANIPAIGTGTWSLLVGSGTVLNLNSPTSSVTSLGVGVNIFQWTIGNGVCPSSSSTVSINRDLPPTVANAGINQTVCANSTVLNGNIPAIGTGTWSVVSGNGIFTNANLNNTTVNSLNAGVNIFQWTIGNGVCASSSSTVSVQQDLNPTPSIAGPNQTVCANNTLLAGNIPAIGTGTWSVVSGNGVFANNNLPNTTVNTLNAGVNVFMWTIGNGVCATSSSTVSVQQDLNPTASSSTPNQTVCANSTTLNGNTPSIGTGTWSVVSGNGAFVNANIPGTVVNLLNPGINIFQWTIGNGVCPTSSSTVSVQQDLNPTPSVAGVNQTVCATSALLAANAPAIGTGTWSIISGNGSFVNANLPNTTVNTLNAGINIFQWTIGNGVCAVSSSTVSIQRDLNPTVSNAGINQTVCATSAILSANIPAIGTGTWSLVSGNGAFVNASLPNTIVNSLNPGVNVFQWTIGNGVCPTSSSTVSVQQDLNPTTPIAGPNQTVCATSAILAGNTPAIGTGTWSLVSGGGSITNPNLPNSGITSLTVGVNVFQWTIGNGVCASLSSTVSIQRDDFPAASVAGVTQSVCGTNATLAGNTPSVGAGLWSIITGSGTIVNPSLPNSAVNSLSLGLNILQWTISNGVCTSNTSTTSIMTYTNPTVANAGINQTVCATTATVTGNTPIIGVGTWSLISGGGTITNSTSATTGITSLGVGVNQFQWSIANGACPVSTSIVNIQRDDFPSAAVAGPNQTICVNNSTLNATPTAVGNGTWTMIAGGGTINIPTNNFTSIGSLTVGVNNFMWTVGNGICPVNTSTIDVLVLTNVAPVSAGPDLQFCGLTTTLSGLTPTVGTGTWTPIGTGPNVALPNNPNTPVTFTAFGTYTYEWTVGYLNCPVEKDTMLITLYDVPTIAVASADQTLCVNNTTTITANIPAVGTGTWLNVAGGGNIVTPPSYSTAVNTLPIGINTFEWVITNGVCPPSRDTISIQIDDNPSNPIAGTDQTICITNTTNLNATIPAIGTGTWSVLAGGGSVTTNTLNNSGVTSLIVGVNTFEWIVSNGVCPNKSDTVNIFVDDLPTVSLAGVDQHTCEMNATLAANSPAIGSGTWIALPGAPSVNNPNSPTSGVSFTNQGIYGFVWIIGNGVCPNSTDTVEINTYISPSNPNAGSDQLLCAMTATMNAITPAIGTGSWYPIGGGNITNTLNPNTGITFPGEGNFGFVWEVSNSPYCVPKRDTVFVTTYANPTPANAGIDLLTDCFKGELFANAPVIGSGKWSILTGEGVFDDVNMPNTFFTSNNDGLVTLAWTISNGNCPTTSDTLEIRINSLLIPQVITPNEDGNNDAFEIKSFSCLNNVKIDIFNRWGNLVYDSSDYKNDFKGLNKNGEMLADDTYFYVIEVANKKYKGYFIIKTN